MSRLPQDLETRLRAAAIGGIAFSIATTPQGVSSAWCELADPKDLRPAAIALRELGARLSMIVAGQPPAPEIEEEEAEKGEPQPQASPLPSNFGGTPIDGSSQEVVYHFDFDGDTASLLVFIAEGGALASLADLFRPADWPEREIMETYNLTFTGHPDPRRLFLDESIDHAVLHRLIPLSTLSNAASTKELWAKVAAASQGNAK